MLDSFGTPLSALVAVGGNSRAARSARAHLQWRDRYGRFIDMGKGIKFKIRLKDGTVRSVNGKFVGAIDGDTGQVYVQNDPSGLQDGFYNVHSANAQEILGSLDDATLAKRGINVGKDTNGIPVPDRSDEDIPNVDEVPFSDAPAGWKRLPDVNGAQQWETEDGDYKLFHSYTYQGGKGKREVWGVKDVRRNPDKQQGWKDIGWALKSVDNSDKLPEPDGLTNEQRAQNLKDEDVARKAQLEGHNDTTVPLAERLAPYDTNGEVAALINSGAGGDAVLDALRKNDAWNNIENDLNHPADVRSPDQKHKDGVFQRLVTEVNGLKKGDIPDTPNGPSGSAPDPDVPNVNAPTADAPAAHADPSVEGADAGLDTTSFNVAQDGFLIPTGKVSTDGTDAGLAKLVTDNTDYLTESGGKRILASTDDQGNVTGFEIANSSPSLDDAKAQAGGAGAPEYYDVSANKVITNDKNLNNPASKEGQSAQDSNSPAGESKPDDTGSDQPVGNSDGKSDQPASSDKPADSGSDSKPAADSDNGPARSDSAPASDSSSTDKPDAEPKLDALGQPIPTDKHALDQRLAYLNRAADRVSPDSARFDDTLKAQKEVQDAVDGFKEPTPEADKKPETDKASEKSAPKAEEKKPAEKSDSGPKDSPEDKKLAEKDAAEKKQTEDENKKPEDKATEALADLLNSKDDSTRLDAAKEILDRAGVKPAEDRASEPARVDNLDQPEPTKATPASPAPSEPATDRTPEVPAAPSAVPESNLPDPSAMSWNELNSELAKPVDPKSDTLKDDLARYQDVQNEFFKKRGGFSNPPKDKDARPGTESVQTPATPTPEPVQAPTPEAPAEPEGDGLPDTVPELEALAGNMEREIAAARPARAKVLNEQVNKIYDKIDSLTPAEAAPAQDATPDVPDTPKVEVDEAPEETAVEAATPEQIDEATPNIAGKADDYSLINHESNASIARNIGAGKELTPQQQSDLDDIESLDDATRADLLTAINDQPNKANTVTSPRPLEEQPQRLVSASRDLTDAEKANPNLIVDPNLIMDDVRKNNPGWYLLPNGDTVIQSKTDANGKKFELVVRRTGRERFFPYILETDKNGNRRAVRVSVEGHAYTTLNKKIARAKKAMNNKDTSRWMNRQRNRENLGKADLSDSPASKFIDGTDLPSTPDENYNKVVAGIANMARDGNTPRHTLAALAEVGGLKPDALDTILESMNRRKIADAQAQIAPPLVESHLDVNGNKLKPGDWVDWTDDRQTRPVKDANGDTVYEKNEDGTFVMRYGKKVAVNEPNPDYGTVFRGQVKSLRDATEEKESGVYSDGVFAVFPELDARGKRKNHQRPRISSQLRIVDGQNAPDGEAFWARKQEKRVGQEKIAAAFNLPDASAIDSSAVERPQGAGPRAVEPQVDPQTGMFSVPGYENVNVPQNKVEASQAIDGVPGVSKVAGDVQPGDVIVGLDDNGDIALDTVLDVQPGEVGQAHIRVVRAVDGGHEIRERDVPPNKLVTFTPDSQAENPDLEAPIADKPVSGLAVGDTVHVDDIGGGVGKIEQILPGAGTDRGDTQFKVRDEAGEVSWIRGDELDQNVPEPEPIDPQAPAWHRAPANSRQKAFIQSFLRERRISGAEQRDIEAALADPNLTKKQASDLIIKFSDRAKRGPVSMALADLVKRIGERQPENKPFLNDLSGAQQQSDAEIPAIKLDKYNGEAVKRLKWSEIRSSGNKAPFENHPDVQEKNFQVGDLIPRGTLQNRYYLQVLEVQGNHKFRARIITQKPDQRVFFGHDVFHDGDTVTTQQYTALNLKRPTPDVAKDYFASPEQQAAIKPRLRDRFKDEMPEVEDPKSLQRMQDRGQKLVDEYNKGYENLGDGSNDEGIQHARADIVRMNGQTYFVKGVDDDAFGFVLGNEHINNEIASNRVLQALGIDDIQMGKLNDNEVIMTHVDDGILPGEDPEKMMHVIDNFWDTPNAWRMGIFDYIASNQDRHEWNWFVRPDGTPVPIDHGGMSWGNNGWFSPFADKLIHDISNNRAPLTTAQLLRARSAIAQVQPEFSSMGMNAEFKSMMSRLDNLIEKVKGMK